VFGLYRSRPVCCESFHSFVPRVDSREFSGKTWRGGEEKKVGKKDEGDLRGNEEEGGSRCH